MRTGGAALRKRRPRHCLRHHCWVRAAAHLRHMRLCHRLLCRPDAIATCLATRCSSVPPSSSPSPPPPPPTISSRPCPFPPPLWMRRVLRRLCSAHRSFRVSPSTLPFLTSATPRAFPFYPPRPPALALSTFCRVTVVAPWRCRPCARTLRQMAFCLMMTVVTADTLTFFSLDRVHCSCWTLHVPCMVLLTCMSSLSSWWGR